MSQNHLTSYVDAPYIDLQTHIVFRFFFLSLFQIPTIKSGVFKVIANKSECPKMYIKRLKPHFFTLPFMAKTKKMYLAFFNSHTFVYCFIHRQRKSLIFLLQIHYQKVLLSQLDYMILNALLFG